MPTLHYLNVLEGDCSIIVHGSKRVTMIDTCNARLEDEGLNEDSARKRTAANFRQKDVPDNPIEYMRIRNIDSVFRFILTHPDMDHMDGLKDIFEHFTIPNFWDTDNTCEKDSDAWTYSRYRKCDWDFYLTLRAKPNHPKRLLYYSGQSPLEFWKEDGIQLLSPTKDLVKQANAGGDWNDSSQVILYRCDRRRVLFPGDAHDLTWTHILSNHRSAVSNIDLLIAPHHGRHSECDFTFLDTLKPKLTLFGNASSKHLAYHPWSDRGLHKITNNQAGSIIVDFDDEASFGAAPVYCTNETFARECLGSETYYSNKHRAWLCHCIP